MSWQQAIITIAVGSLIGFITNWIAIKMLFRPLIARYMFGIKLPFTPGVIPKEKERLARSIGDAVSEHLLTSDHVSRQLLTPNAEAQVLSWIEDKIHDIEEKPAGTILKDFGAGEDALEKGKAVITRRLVNAFRNSDFQHLLAARLTGGIENFLDRRPGEMVGTESFYRIKKGTVDFLKRAENRRHLENIISQKVEEWSKSTSTVRECIPESMLEELQKSVYHHGPRVVEVIESYLNSQETRGLLVKRVESFFRRNLVRRVMGNVLGVIGKDPAQIADNIVEEIEKFFAEQENRDLMVHKLNEALDQQLDNRVCDLVAGIDPDNFKKLLHEISEFAGDAVFKDEVLWPAVDKAENFLAGSDLTWRQLLNSSREDIEGYVRNLIEKAADSREFEEQAGYAVGEFTNWLLNTRTADLWPALAGDKERVKYKIMDFYRYIVINYIPAIVDFIDMGRLVRRRVDELEVEQVEELVLHIMKQELTAITWLGAILGGTIGVTMVILQSLGYI